MRRISLLSLVVGILVSTLLAFYLFRTVSFDEITSLIGNADRGAVGAFLVLSLSTSFFRAWRYRIMLRAVGCETPFPGMFLVVLVRNTFSDLLPAKLGTLIYIFLTRTRLGIPLSSGSATFALAFLLDSISILPLILVCALLSSSQTEISLPVLVSAALALAAAIGALFIFLPRGLSILGSLLPKLWFLSISLRKQLSTLLMESASRVKEIEHAGIWGRLLCLSVLIRLGKYVGLYVFLYALLMPQGYTLSSLPFPLVFFGLCAAEFAASVPFLSGLGGFGAYQGAWISTFTLLGFPLDLAKVTSLGHHLFTQAYGYGLGAAAFLLVSLPLFARETHLNRTLAPEHHFSFGAKCIAALVVVGVLAWGALLFL